MTMLKVIFLDTQPHIYSVLKRKFEREGFEVITEGQNLSADLIVMGKAEANKANSYLDMTRSKAPVILLSNEQSQNQDAKNSFTHLKMPFRPSQLMALARRAVASAA